MKTPDIKYPDDEEEKNIVFHYNRSERLKKAPKEVQDFYNGQAPKAPVGIFKALVHTKGSRTMLAILCLVLGVFLIVNFMGPSSDSAVIANTSLKLSAFSFEDTIYVSLKCNQKNDDISTPLKTKIIFKTIDNNSAVTNSKEIEDYITEKEVFFRTTFTDYDIIKIEAEIELQQESKVLTCSVEHK